ncbi:hypothetical protein BS78_01G503300 [Paspalum vaginatum]|nr:hypothetical protein BS78_01G503300 [Paspalum vaginatum]
MLAKRSVAAISKMFDDPGTHRKYYCTNYFICVVVFFPPYSKHILGRNDIVSFRRNENMARYVVAFQLSLGIATRFLDLLRWIGRIYSPGWGNVCAYLLVESVCLFTYVTYFSIQYTLPL